MSQGLLCWCVSQGLNISRCVRSCLRVYYVGVLDPTTNKMMVNDTEKYLLQPHIPGIVLSLYNTPHYNMNMGQGILCRCVRSYYQQDDGV